MDAEGQHTAFAFICSNCGASCTEKRKLKRFLERHPSLCTQKQAADAQRAAFTRQLASDARCVEDETDE